MKVWSMVVLLLKRELNSLLQCLLVFNLVVYCMVVLVMEWTAAITGDSMGLFLEKLRQPFSRAEMDVLLI
jgi:hypothetical protein